MSESPIYPDESSIDLVQSFQESEKEKAILLSLSHEIASTWNRQELLPVLKEKIKAIGLSSDLSIWVAIGKTGKFRSFMVDPNPRRVNHPDYSWAVDTDHSYPDGFFELVMDSPEPIVFNLPEIINDRRYPDYLKMIYQSGFSQVIGIPLRVGYKSLGAFYVYITESQCFTTHQQVLLKGFTNQLSIAVSNILSREELTIRESEKAALLSLSKVFAAVRNKEELLPLLRAQFKQVGFYTDLAVSLVNEDGVTASSYLVAWNKRRHQHPDYHHQSMTPHIICDGIFDRSLHAKEPVSFDLDQLIRQPQVPSYIRFLYDKGVRHMINAPLRERNETIGLLQLFSDRVTEISPQKIYFLEGMAQQLGTAVSKIRATEAILREEGEISMLLSISCDIATIREKEDLLHVICRRLKGLVNFSHCDIILLDIERDLYFPFLLETAFSDLPDLQLSAAERTGLPIKNTFLERLKFQHLPVVLDLCELVLQGIATVYVQANYDQGIRKMIFVTLQRSGGTFAGLSFYSQTEDNFDENSLRIIRGICSHISISLSNILANDEIIEREREKTLLLNLGNEISACTDRHHFAAILGRNFQMLFGEHQSSVDLLDDTNETHSVWFQYVSSNAQDDLDYSTVLREKYPVNDGFFNQVLNSASPVSIDLNEAIRREEVPAYITVTHALGYRTWVGRVLVSKARLMGTLNIILAEKADMTARQLRMFQGMSDQVSLALANLLATEAVLERENEKEILLNLSNDICACEDKSQYIGILRRNFAELLSIQEFVIVLINDDKKTHSVWLPSVSEDQLENSDYKRILTQKHNIYDGVFNMDPDHPAIMDMDELMQYDSIPDYIRFFYSFGCKELFVGALVVNNEVIGSVNVMRPEKRTLNDSQLRVFQGMCDQMAISISNIRAREEITLTYHKIHEQVQEISLYKVRLEEENEYLHAQIGASYDHDEIIGSSPGLQQVFKLVSQVAASDSTVLLLGETGTGKELVARAIHSSSSRGDRLMIKVNCAALPAGLIESELFGHERGSFTGAIERRIGKFEMANKSSLFLDEIGELLPELQIKLLRVLQEKEIERVGGKGIIKTDVRIIAATNRNLLSEVAAGRFRRDLYYRLNVFPITIPPLRNRPGDIPGLVAHFIKKYSAKTGKKVYNISDSAMRDLIHYHWPGNIRELEHLVERCILMSDGATISQVFLPENKVVSSGLPVFGTQTLEEHEREYILHVLRFTRGRISGPGGAAELMGLIPTTLYSKMRKLDIQKDHL